MGELQTTAVAVLEDRPLVTHSSLTIINEPPEL